MAEISKIALGNLNDNTTHPLVLQLFSRIEEDKSILLLCSDFMKDSDLLAEN